MRGFTLIELMITIVVVAIGVALALPSWENLVQKRNVTSAAEQVAAFLAYAQSEAIKTNEEITVTIKRDGDGSNWCVGAINEAQKIVANRSHCECDVAPGNNAHCSFNGESQYVSQGDFEDFVMDSSAQGPPAGPLADQDFNFTFDPIRGVKVVIPGGSITRDLSSAVDTNLHQFSFLSENAKFKLQVEVAVTGRVNICNPDSGKKVPGFESCQGGPIVVPPPPVPLP